jgi:pyridoxamine 5'-phosphate oxidase
MCFELQFFAQNSVRPGRRARMVDVTSSTPDLPELRRDYVSEELTEEELAEDWPTQFGRWLAAAVSAGLAEPNAMVLATADAAGRPSARSVLLKGYDVRGFVFFTNHESRKGIELSANPYGSLVFPWYPLHRQVIVCGPVERTSRAETEDYFAIRPRGAQLAAWASAQSQPIPDRMALVQAWEAAERRFPGEVPAPPHWGGYRLAPTSVEFWQGRISRLHDRLRYRLAGDAWVIERLSP